MLSTELKVFFNSVTISLIGTALSFLSAWFWYQKKQAIDRATVLAGEHEKVKYRINELETKLALVNQAIVPISTAFQAILIKELTHYHTPEMDALMLKIGPPNTLTPQENSRLIFLLEERTRDLGPLISEKERGAAYILPVVMARALEEYDSPIVDEELKLKVVGMPTEDSKPETPEE